MSPGSSHAERCAHAANRILGHCRFPSNGQRLRRTLSSNLMTEPKIDCHTHVFDPERFPYAGDTFYRPSGPEIGTASFLGNVLDAHGVKHALLVAPNSGYGLDKQGML